MNIPRDRQEILTQAQTMRRQAQQTPVGHSGTADDGDDPYASPADATQGVDAGRHPHDV
jgi:hypothetical protein